MIGIIDYGMGNLYSVSKALERLNYESIVSGDVDQLKKTKGLILPGVGSFKDAMHILNETGLSDFIREAVENGMPLLGICLGMQLLFDESEENGRTEGLRLLKGRVVRFPGTTSSGEAYKVPHMGWNRLHIRYPSPLFENVEEGYVYFVHSYYVDSTDQEVVLASSTYDVEVPAVVGQNYLFGTQFHPEKSSSIGMNILKNYADLVARKENE
ncbi:imidazole glycerol phosphate synthase, glutamine amidotransferase subunit [Anoxybacillus sp. B7M1]|uniref:imidazole glycerol phosphate synthase subunit HisH n=1 Tax=unclassified Anoxybacillus TaxID=2639704 RepID=UPI0005CD4E9F|nr:MULTISPECIES: imidazole glycerol phosphate synthase subunit HisH [unclassified Anoxybacillus]ANB55807.1 imidazole glycerol phosphate synthase, glutamine amidotransferase subunit [Anoxybacillus sp. B2M1]ANB65516.1 imidazole glycerol phosphate synthase, glutamine amidotransferase subunit [Anoxybacillus sp. B7M1]